MNYTMRGYDDFTAKDIIEELVWLMDYYDEDLEEFKKKINKHYGKIKFNGRLYDAYDVFTGELSDVCESLLKKERKKRAKRMVNKLKKGDCLVYHKTKVYANK